MEEEKRRNGGKGGRNYCEEPSRVSLPISGLKLVMGLLLRIFYYLALEINVFAAKSLLTKWGKEYQT